MQRMAQPATISMVMDTGVRFSASVIEAMRHDIQEAGGNEVFWAGMLNADAMVVSVRVGARGTGHEVLVHNALVRELSGDMRQPDGKTHAAAQVLIHNHPSGLLEPSGADMGVAASALENSIGFYIVNNDVSDVYVVTEPVMPRKLVPLDEKDTVSLLAAGGPLSVRNPHYEERPSQLALLSAVCRAFNGAKVGVFEAGTGVGKSYAYLVPAMLWAAQNRERVVVSTGTINLQQQLLEKDIPAAAAVTGKKIKAVLVKGRQNYVCLRRLAQASDERDMFSDETEVLDRIFSWAQTSGTGSRSDLSFMPPEAVWSRVNSESDACFGMRCPHRERCFVMKVRKEASDANLIVVNHHLLFADIESRLSGTGYDDTAVLPPYRRLVFDEAHGIEDSATSFFSESISRFKVTKQVNLLYRQRHGTISGFLVQLLALSKNCDATGQNAAAAVSALKDAVLYLDETALSLLQGNWTERLHGASSGQFSQVLAALETVRAGLGTFTALVRDVLDGIDEDDRDVPAVWESKSVLRRLEDMLSLCRNFLLWNEHEDTVFWIQKQRINARTPGDSPVTYVQFFQTPLDIAPLMNRGVFEPMSTVVCTSATLRTGTDFSYWLRRTGASFVEPGRMLTGEFASPFNYEENVLFAVTSDAPAPTSPLFQDYVEQAVPRLIRAASGRTLVLFTSYESLWHTFAACRSSPLCSDFTLLKQGDDDRFRLLEHFKADVESVLFATDSFWEGVDVPGESLSQVVIAKLPFTVPNDPVFAARSEAVEKRGGSSFMELSVPEAVIKFRQGFGRLVRCGSDRGVVVALDNRLVEKNYGRIFTASVPRTQRLHGPLSQVVRAVENFLKD